MIPSAKIDRLPRAPPLNMLKRPSREPPPLCLWSTAFITVRSTPGMVTKTPIRYTASSITVKRMRLRSSGTLPMFEKAERALMDGSGSRRRLRLGAPGRLEQDDLAACLLNLLRGGLGEGVRRHGHRLRQLATAEDLDAIETALDEAACNERLLVHSGALSEDLEVSDVDLCRHGREGIDEAALGQATLDGRLPALEVRLESARPRVLPLLTATGRLAEPGADAPAQPHLVARGARRLGELRKHISHDRP